jgi:hypothetical protein
MKDPNQDSDPEPNPQPSNKPDLDPDPKKILPDPLHSIIEFLKKNFGFVLLLKSWYTNF